jgi:hypothetical protein
MESLKPVSEIHQPDQRNLLFVRTDTGKPRTLDEHHALIESAVLQSSVPKEVRSYFATIQNLCIYAWFSYDLYAVVQFLCFAVVEMALRIRLPRSGKDNRGLSALLREANKEKLIKAKGFSHIRSRRQSQAEQLRADRQIMRLPESPIAMKFSVSPIPKSDYGEILAKALPYLRNSFAHPQGHAIIMPWEALRQLRITAELINQLFP